MCTKRRFYKSSFLVTLLLFFLCLQRLYAGGVLSSPRMVYVIKTNHFDIIFPKESAERAHFIAGQADSLYEKAKTATGLEKDFSMPLIISPDSSVLKVEYTNRPYNRIVIFDSVADSSQTGDDVLVELLYKEIFQAVSCSIRSPFNELVYKFILGDPYQPAALINLPFSFVEAYSDINSGAVNDRYFQQLLIQAKIEGKFPTWLQAAAIRDIHPGNDLSCAAATGFAAFLMQSRGLEKYSEFWNECGKLHPYFMNGIFYKVYGKPVGEVWKEFEETIPLPREMAQMEALESLSREISENDRQGAFANILYTNYGLVWYDSIRHEVDIFDSNSFFKIRQLLFIADNITKLALSPDGRYIIASYIRDTVRPEFKEEITRIFDLKERKFLDQKLMLRDACFISGKDNSLMIAGISVSKKRPVLQIYSFNADEKKNELLYEKQFDRKASVHSLTSGKAGAVSYLLSENSETSLVVEELENSEAEDGSRQLQVLASRRWTLFGDNSGDRSDESSGGSSGKISGENEKALSPFFIQYIPAEDLYTFSYYPDSEGALVRSGYIKDEKVYLQQCDISGGVYYPLIVDGRLYYCASKISHNEFRSIPFEKLAFAEGKLVARESHDWEPLSTSELSEISETSATLEAASPAELTENSSSSLPPVLDLKARTLGEYTIKNYNPFKYLADISYTPLFAIRDITVEDGAVFWPSLGVYLSADSDPMRNTELILSGGIDFLRLSFEKEFNTVPQETLELYNQIFGRLKKYNFAAYLENSSTPVDISAGAVFHFNKDGDYDFKAVAKTAWKIPVGNILRDMNFSISSIYSASTDYYDEKKIEYHKPLPGWTPLRESYELLELSFSMGYSNSHQYGISKYERRGLTLGWRLYSLWDIYEIEALRKYRDLTKQEIKDGKNTELTEVQLEKLYEENLIDLSQLSLGFVSEIEIPRLNPLEIKNGWVLSLPTTVRAELMNKTGTALDVKVESLLLGNEIQNGIPFLYLFFSRMGLKAGYDFKLEYDTKKVQLPDIRRKNYLADVFSQTNVSDSLYLIYNTDFLIPTGKLSETQLSMDLRGEYFIKTNGFKLSFNISAVF